MNGSFPKLYIFILILLVIAKISSTTPFFKMANNICYVLYVLIVFVFLFKGKNVKWNRTLLLLIFEIILGIMLMQPPSYFKSWERLGGFLLSIFVLSPLVSSEFINNTKKKIFYFTIYGMHFVVIASFILYLLGINMAQKYETNRFDWGFGGITTQSMILAPCSAFIFLYSIWKILFQEVKTKYLRLVYVFFLVISVWLIFVAGSRGALIGTIIALLPILSYLKNVGIKLMKIIILSSIFIFIVPNSLYDKAFYAINKKQASAVSANSVTSSRDEKWLSRMDEFIDSPILGIGFSAETHFTSDDDVAWIMKTGNIEPGSSWLAVLSMTGIIGFAVISKFLFGIFVKLKASYKKDSFSCLLFSYYLFLLLNGLFEGWIFSSGSFVFFLFWLTVGVSECIIYKKK